ncbi:formyl-CoA transferase/succinyl-CoA--D-citramalate CoA-transferase [Solibacillus kalamii]|uniref:Formyl-CoA transferase n=1 Tax=Solibacillus kalamii TaxID=1748298 RepID=A0ABX3ZFI8_9BACL|nr:CoA transferase [Solibacillus kalamii]MBM7665971.1 formyl-CoA transferase/succinyl-CoA--D-citramalate CoA-transferase [Solibacillus kalamii]OUZ38479.1 formyl-CoA transferase [Solibacillus kalamii]
MKEHYFPLDNIRVLELGTLIAGPFAGRLLGDFGAEVIKIEPPDKQDPMRLWGQQKDGQGLQWPIQSRNKKSITLNLRESEGQGIFKQLVEKADVIIENFRPGTMEKWGLSYEVLSAINPGIIMVRTSGFGQTGPYKERAGFGSVGEAMGGLRYVTGFADRPPSRIGISIGDSLAAIFATLGCLTAIYERTRSGKGQVVDTAIYESVFSVMESIIPDYLLVDYVRERMGNVLPGIAPSNIYLTKDGTYIVIGANADGVFKRLCEAMNRPELAEDERYKSHQTRGVNLEELDKIIEQWTKTLSAEESLAILAEKGVPSGLIYSAKEMIQDPQFQAREMIVNVEHDTFGEFPMPGVVPKLSRTPGGIRFPGSTKVGQHNEEVYGSLLNLTKAQLDQLNSKGIV